MRGVDLYRWAVQLLRLTDMRDPDFSARYLLAFVLGCEIKELFLQWEKKLSLSERWRFKRLVVARARGIPLAYLVRYVDFYGMRFSVVPGVLIPRPDTEHVVYAVEELHRNFRSILDVGTGTGVIAIAMATLFPDAKIDAIDVSFRAVWIARANARRLGRNNVRVFRCDFLSHPPKKHYDLILSNPPYIAPQDAEMIDRAVRLHEPKRALFGGEDGLLFYRRMAFYARDHLAENGYVVVEVDYKWERVQEIFAQVGFRSSVKHDYQDLPRVLVVHR